MQFAYSSGKTTVTDSQRATTLKFSSIGGMLRPTESNFSSGATNSTWDASGNLLKATNAVGSTDEYSYDDAGRVVRLVVRNPSSTTVTSVRYTDATSLNPSMIASPGKLRAFVYDAKGDVTGFSEFKTGDATGESGFDAKASGQQSTVGVRYDSSNRLAAALVYSDGQQTAAWNDVYDASGNLRLAWNQMSGWAFGVTQRNAWHRAIYMPGDNREARVTYDARGRVVRFAYNEYPTALNGGLYRLLTVNYGYAADGKVISRTATVAKNNGGSTSIDAATSISGDELDQWLNNYESGANPVGPAANRLGWVRSMLGAAPEAGLENLPGVHFKSRVKLGLGCVF